MVPIQVIRWYRMQCYGGTDSCATVVPIRRYCHYNAPIEVYDRIYYRYADPNYSITEMPLSIEDCKLIKKAIILLENKKDKNNEDTIQVLNKVQNRLKSILNFV